MEPRGTLWKRVGEVRTLLCPPPCTMQASEAPNVASIIHFTFHTFIQSFTRSFIRSSFLPRWLLMHVLEQCANALAHYVGLKQIL